MESFKKHQCPGLHPSPSKSDSPGGQMVMHLAQMMNPLWNCGKASFPSCKTRGGWESGTESTPPDKVSEVTVQEGLNHCLRRILLRLPTAPIATGAGARRGARATQPADGPPDVWPHCYAFAHCAFKQKPGPFESSVQRPLLFHLGPAAHGFSKSRFPGARCVLGRRGAWYRLWLPIGAQEHAVNCV